MQIAARTDAALEANDRKELMITAITLRNIPPKLQKAIRQRAGREGLSLNKVVLRMLEEATGEENTKSRELHHDLDHLAGTWSDQEAAGFDAALVEQRSVDPDLWE